MAFEEIRSAIRDIRSAIKHAGVDDRPATIALVLPRKHPPRGDKVRFTGRRGPLGWIMSAKHTMRINRPWDVVARFDCTEVEGFLDRLELEDALERAGCTLTSMKRIK